MSSSKLVNKALIDENADLEFSIKDNVIIGKPLEDDFETDSIGNLLFKNFNDFPDYIGQINVQTGEKTTFGNYKDRSVRCALWLKKQGICPGDVIGSAIPLHNDDYVPVLAAIFIGATINPWPYQLTPLASEYYFKVIKPKVMFAYDGLIEMLAKAAKDAQVDCKFIVVGKHPDYPSLSDLMAEQDQTEVDRFRHFEPEDPKNQVAALIFTSGTTSTPKAIMLSYESLVKNRFNYMIHRTHCNLLMYSTFSWNTGLFFFTMSIRKFLTRILHLKFNAEEAGAIIEKFKVNLAFVTPTVIIKMNELDVFKKYDFSSLEVMLLVGSKPTASIMEATRKALPHVQISNTLGMTDAGGRLTVQTKKCKTRNSIGRVVGSVQLKIVDPNTGSALGANQEGELCFKLNNMMIGYLNNPEETKKALDEEGWFHSGDLGCYDENGEVWITDRLKDMVISRDTNISPSQVQDILLKHPAVADVAVVAVPHETDYERPFAFVVKKPGTEVTAEELIELPTVYDEMLRLTGGVAFIDEIPYNSNGKKSTKDLKAMAQAYVKNNVTAC